MLHHLTVLFFIALFLVGCGKNHSLEEDKQTTHQALSAIKVYEYNAVEEIVDDFHSPILKDCFLEQIAIQKRNRPVKDSTLRAYFGHQLNDLEGSVLHLTYGDYLHNVGKVYDTLAYKHYYEAYALAKELDDIPLQNASLNRICFHFRSSNSDQYSRDKFKEYLEAYKLSSADAVDSLWTEYFDVFYLVLDNYHNKTNLDRSEVLAKLEVLKEKDAPDPYVEGLIYFFEGIYNQLNEIDPTITEQSYERALELFEKSNLEIAKQTSHGVYFDKAINMVSQGKYEEALAIFRKDRDALKSQTIPTNDKWRTAHWLKTCFEKMGQLDSANYYTNLKAELQEELKVEELAIGLHEIDTKYSLHEKDEELKQVSKSKNFFQKNFFLLLPLALLLGFLTYLFRKRYQTSDSEKQLMQHEYEASLAEKEELQSDLESISDKIKTLEEEKQETIERLKELKDVVTKDFIILQDKSKVYVEELMFIKSDDHYLLVHLHGKKDNFVRGKLSTIIKELPPNFVRCHRSYIVNENYIEKFDSKTLTLTDGSEVPVSKTYRSQFELK